MTTTDATGRYIFKNLLPGTYTVTESAIAGYGDITDTDGAGNGKNVVAVTLTKTPTVATAAELGITGMAGLAATDLVGYARADYVEGRAATGQ